MKIKEKHSWWRNRPMTIQEAIEHELADGSSRDGKLESLEAEIEQLRVVLARFMANYITTIEELNELARYEKYEVVE